VNGDAQAARHLARQAGTVSHVSGRGPWRAALRWINGAMFNQPSEAFVASGWCDSASQERPGWRERAAHLDHQTVFAVAYQPCRRCGLAWVEQPYTDPLYQRCGLAGAGLAALRIEHPRLSWHTLGGHLTESQAFWAAVGADVCGGYRQRQLCSHVRLG
jgi:hypothetical protein